MGKDPTVTRGEGQVGRDWVTFEPIEGGWPDLLWSRDDTTLSDDDVDTLRHEISRRESELSGTMEARPTDFASGELPKNLLLVKEETE